MIRLMVTWLIALASVVAPASNVADEPSEVLARWSEGTVTKGRFDSWVLARTGRLQEPSPELLREYVLVQQLRAAALANGLEKSPEVWVLSEQRKHQLASQAIMLGVKQKVSVGDEEVEQRLRAEPQAFYRPKRYKLATIFKALPPTAPAANEVRREMQALRQRLVDGADFGDLAREHSESTSYARAGQIGFFALSELPADIAAVIEAMKPGDLSPVVEHAAGLSLFRCEQVMDAKRPKPAEQRKTMTNILYREKMRDWESRIRDEVEQLSGTLELAESELSALRQFDELDTILSNAERPWESKIQAFKEGRARWFVAQNYEFLADPIKQAELFWLEDEVLAKVALRQAVRADYEAGSSLQLKQAYQSYVEHFKASPEFELRGVQLATSSFAKQQQVLEISRQIQDGVLSLADAAQRYSLHSSREHGGYLGWFDTRQLLNTFGPGLGKQVRRLAREQKTGLLKVDSGYWIFELLAKRPSKPQAFEEIQAELAEQSAREAIGRLELNLTSKYFAAQNLTIETPQAP